MLGNSSNKVGEHLESLLSLDTALIQDAVDMMIIMDTAGRIVSVNHAVYEITGYTAEELIGQSPLKFIPEKMRASVEEAMRKLLSGDTVHRIEVELNTKDGKSVVIEIRGRAIRDGDQIVGMFQMGRDVTERKLAEQKLRVQGEVAENMFEGVMLIRASDGVIVYVNPRFEQMMGYDPSELVGKNVVTINAPIGEKSPEDVAREIQTPLKKHGTWSGEIKNLRKDGSPLWCRSNISTLESPEYGRVWVDVHEDITDYKKMEEKLGALHRHATRLATAANVDEIVRHTLDAMDSTLGFHYAGFEAVENGFVNIKGVRGMPTSLEELPMTGSGVVVKAANTKTTLRIPDIRREPAYLDTKATNNEGQPATMLSELAVPVIVDGSAVAVLNVESELLDAFTEKDQVLLETLAMHVASAVGRLTRVVSLRRRAEELAALQATVLDITSNSDLPVLLQTIVERASRLLRVSSGGMYVCDPQRREARCVVAYKTQGDIRGTVLKSGEGVAGAVAETGKPILVDDYRTWEGRAAAYEKTKPFVAVLGVPVIWQGQVTGVIDVLDDRPQHFTQADQELLTLLANHAAIAVENARLLDQEKCHAKELTNYSTNLEQVVLDRTKALRESEARFKDLAELLPQTVFEVDGTGNFTFLNHAGLASTGYTEEDIKDLNALQMFAPQDRGRAKQNITRALHGEDLGATEYVTMRKDGSTFPVLIHSTRIMREDKPVGLRGIVIDLTEQKRMEAALLKSQRMATIGELAGWVGHDLRNPLTGMTGAIYYLEKKEGSGLSEKGKEMLRIIEEDIRRSDKIINDLVEYSKELRLEFKQTDAGRVVEEALKSVKIPESIRTINSAKVLPRLKLDANQMRRVFVNIIQNAVDAMPGGGTLKIASAQSEDKISITFTDTGEGMNDKTVKSIWTPLFTTKAKGMGFGLPIAKRFVEAHGGAIDVETCPGRGSSFTVTLPINGCSGGEGEVKDQ